MTDNPMARYVSIYGPHTSPWDKQPEPATVNWSSIGSVTPEQARQFAAAILAAADKADELNKVTA